MQPKEFWFYYAAIIAVAVMIFIRRRPRRGMRLKLRGGTSSGGPHLTAVPTPPPAEIKGEVHTPPATAPATPNSADSGRMLNVMFNYNGHTWDAYEVLGLPAGSSSEKVDTALKENLIRVDAGSRPFIEAAHQAIQRQLRKVSNGS